MIWALHGNLGHPGDWDGLRHHLPDHEFRCLNLWEEPVESFETWCHRLNEAAALWDSAPVLLGYSLGARLAMQALCRAGAPWRSAIFISGHPGLEDAAARAARREQDRNWAATLREEGWETFAAHWNAQPVLAGNPVSPRQQMVLCDHAEAVARSFDAWSLGLQPDLRGALAAVSVPQLWVAGSEDPKFPALQAAAVARIPPATGIVIKGSGHRVPLQNPAALAECLRSFLEDNQ